MKNKKLFYTFLSFTIFGLVGCGELTSSNLENSIISENTPSSAQDSQGSIYLQPSVSNSSSDIQEHIHNLTKVNEVAATMTKDGHKVYYTCDGCEDIFADANGKTITTFDKVILKATTPFRQKQYSDLNYCEYMPEIANNEKVPLVLFLHGAGERGSDNELQLKNAILKVVNYNSNSQFMNSIVIAPQCPENKQWVDTPWANGNYKLSDVNESEIMKKIVSLVEEYRTFDYVDINRIYVVGLSMGGFGTWDLIARHPELFAAAVPICGGGPTDAIKTLRTMPIYTFHGTNDGTVPYAGTKEMVNLITNFGGKNINFVTFDGAGHGIWDSAITYAGNEDIPGLENWLFALTKVEINDDLFFGKVNDYDDFDEVL